MSSYTGRFAPSPTGPLHMGSLYTAVAGFLDARANSGRWLLRIEDIDPPREQAGATQAIIQSLQSHGLFWDGDIVYQSRRDAAYQAAVKQLQAMGVCFYCRCSRKQLAHCHGDYSGYCRDKHWPDSRGCAIRLRTDDQLDTGFNDRLLGRQQPAPTPPGCCHDFVIRRKDGLYAYQLAVVVDDIDQGVTDIVRGSDILDCTFKQAWLYHYLGRPRPRYLHLPVLNNDQGQKLSKQNMASAIDDHTPTQNLRRVLELLNQPQPPESCNHPGDILQWAVQHWAPEKLQQCLSISAGP